MVGHLLYKSFRKVFQELVKKIGVYKNKEALLCALKKKEGVSH